MCRKGFLFEQSDQEGLPKKVSCKSISREDEGGILVGVCTVTFQAEGGAFQAEGGAFQAEGGAFQTEGGTSARPHPPESKKEKAIERRVAREWDGDRGVEVI